MFSLQATFQQGFLLKTESCFAAQPSLQLAILPQLPEFWDHKYEQLHLPECLLVSTWLWLHYLPDKFLFIPQNPTSNHGSTSIAPGGERVGREESEEKPQTAQKASEEKTQCRCSAQDSAAPRGRGRVCAEFEARPSLMVY